jgi:pyruvate dehydrogenase kinase 2/3/4
LNEILKNSCVAIEEDSINNGKIIIDYSEGEKDIIIKISDNERSFPVEDINKMMTYPYSSSPLEIIEEYETTNKPIISGFGFGLPTARLYAKYFGGKSSDQSNGK